MATTSSSDDGSLAPKDFLISTSTDSGGRLSPNRQKCPLCRRFRKHFYCKECIHGGLFYSSRVKSDRYIDKQKKLLELEDKKRTLEQISRRILENRIKRDLLRWKIKQVKERNVLLKLAIEEKSQKKTSNSMRLEELTENNRRREAQLPLFNTNVNGYISSVGFHRDNFLSVRNNHLRRNQELKIIAKRRTQQLLTYIFPITTVKPSLETESASSDDMANALAEASQTIYIKDRWEYTDFMGEMKFCIAGPTLPASGNYSSYDIWVAHNQDSVPGSNSATPVERNPAYCISAALTYTAQLITLLSHFLNVRLPYKMVYSDFCSSCMNEDQLARRVARLNANILYICFSQNVDLCALRSSETIHNILQLIENERADLGRQGPMEFDPHLASALEQPISENLKVGEDSDSEEGDSFSIEWEAVPHVQCPEIAAGSVIPQTPQMTSTQQTSSMAGGLVNNVTASIASIWHSVTGR